MIKKLKPGKISIVVFLTFLIWVWSDLSQDAPLTLYDVRVNVAPSADKSLWVNFAVEQRGLQQGDPNLQDSVTLDSVILKGPASRVSEVNHRKNRGTLDLNLFVVPEQEGLAPGEPYTLNVLDFLRRSDVIRNLGLTVESCEPQRLTLVTQKLVERDVPVECVGIDPGQWMTTLEPSSVTAYVPAGADLKARIRLSLEEQAQAKTKPIERTPYIELAPQKRREVPAKVKITLTPAQNPLTEFPVRAVYGLCLSSNLQGKYNVVLENDPLQLTRVMIKATEMARQAYFNAPMQLVLYIKDEDVQAVGPIERDFVFTFPDEYVRTGEIVANQPAPKARFTLVPIAVETKLESPL
jgi:hypothetical protein